MPDEMHTSGRPSACPPVGALYEIGHGRHLMLHHAGSGAPTVVFEAGAGAFGLDYFHLCEAVAQHTTAALYDRAGSGWSDPAVGHRSAAEIVTDLREGLRVSGVNGPYLLVGHSFGGLLVRAFAQRFPSEVAGLVLVDPAAEGMPMVENVEESEAMVRGMIAQLRSNPSLLREWYPDLVADWEKLPEKIRHPLIARHTEPPFDEAGLHDMLIAHSVLDEVVNGPALPEVPVVVLTGMRVDQSPGQSDADVAAFNQIKLDAHRALASSLPRGEHRVFDDVGHRFTSERPDLVLNAILDIVARTLRS